MVLIDRAQAHQMKRQAFGFNMPALNLFKAGPREEKLDRLEVKLTDAHRGADGKWVLTTDEDAVWRQIDTTELNDEPHAGSAMLIRKAMLGSFFCKVDGQTAIRCARSQ